MKPTELLTDLGIPYVEEGHEHTRPGWLQLDCPFCSPGWRHWRMGFNLAYGYVNCWSCGKHSLSDALAEASGKNWREVKPLLDGLDRERGPKRERPTGTLKVPRGVQDMAKSHREYLEGRNLNPAKIARLWGVQGIGMASQLAWRLFIPIHLRGEVVSWTTRSISDSHATRYRSAGLTEERVRHKDLLFSEDYCRHVVIICEGPMDVFRIGPGAVATLGTSYSRSQMLRMSKYPVRYVCFDNEKSAQKRAEELCADLEVFSGRTFNIRLDAKDAAEASNKEIKAVRRLLK